MATDYAKSIMPPYPYKMPPPEEMKVYIEILDLYKRRPCLWDQDHHLRHVKVERIKALNILLEKFKTISPEANIFTIKRKIDNMRHAYKREYKKVLEARLNGQQEHIPVLWYYHHLTFLDAGKDENDSCTDSVSETTENSIKLEQDNYDTVVVDDNNTYEGNQSTEDCDQPHLSPPRKKIKFSYEEDKQDVEVSQSRQSQDSDHSHLNTTKINERVSETFGRTVGLQLQELEPVQRYIAEKLISDVIFYGRLRALNKQTNIDNINL